MICFVMLRDREKICDYLLFEYNILKKYFNNTERLGHELS